MVKMLHDPLQLPPRVELVIDQQYMPVDGMRESSVFDVRKAHIMRAMLQLSQRINSIEFNGRGELVSGDEEMLRRIMYGNGFSVKLEAR